jgi:hypothetical protein
LERHLEGTAERRERGHEIPEHPKGAVLCHVCSNSRKWLDKVMAEDPTPMSATSCYANSCIGAGGEEPPETLPE